MDVADTAGVESALQSLRQTVSRLNSWRIRRGVWRAYGAAEVEFVDFYDDSQPACIRVSPSEYECWLSVWWHGSGELSADLGRVDSETVATVVKSITGGGLTQTPSGWYIKFGRRHIKLMGGGHGAHPVA